MRVLLPFDQFTAAAGNAKQLVHGSHMPLQTPANTKAMLISLESGRVNRYAGEGFPYASHRCVPVS